MHPGTADGRPLELIVGGEGGERDVEVQVNDGDATTGDLAAALGLTGALTVDGRPIAPDVPLSASGVHAGARVGAGAGRETRPAGTLEVAVVGGLAAGARVPLGGSAVTVGRSPGCTLTLPDSSVSREHCRIALDPSGRVVISDCGSSNGTFVDDVRVSDWSPVPPTAVVRVGDSRLAVRPARTDDRPRRLSPGELGALAFNRPPRTVAADEDALLRLPTPAAAVQRPPFNVASIVVPLLLGGVMVAALHNVTYALFALLSPLMVLANWWESRYRGRRSMRRDVREYSEALARLEAEVARRRADELTRRRAADPDIAEVRRRAGLPSARLWERRPDAADFLRITCGFADAAWTPPHEEPRGPLAEDVKRILEQSGRLPLVPVTATLAGGGAIGLVGARGPTMAAARALVCQLATHQGPADLEIAVAVAAEHRSDWEWTKWLPHTRDVAAASGARLLGAGDDAGGLLDELTRRRQGGAALDRTTLAIVDGESLLAGRAAPGADLLRTASAGGLSAIVLAPTADRLPAACSAVVTVSEGSGAAALEEVVSGRRVEPFALTGLTTAEAVAHARELARFDDPELVTAGAELPERVPLLPLLGLHDDDPGTLTRRWNATRADAGLEAAIGRIDAGPFVLDLVRDGPHALVGGTTGSGKSELLRSLVAALAAERSPDDVTFALLDFKGGSTFREIADLPHAVGLATDLDPALARRALRCLWAELTWRETVLHAAGAGSLSEYVAQPGTGRPPLPRLVVVIDEFGEMVRALPDFLSSLVGIARRGRSLGVHLVLATQKPATAVNDEIRANTAVRIALRVQDRNDSLDVIETPAAAELPREFPGRAHVRLGPGEVVAVQTAYAAARTLGEEAPPVEVRPFVFGRRREDDIDVRLRREAAADDLSRFVAQAAAAFAAGGRPAPRRPWLDPLPDSIDFDAIFAREDARTLLGAGPADAPFALADDPERQAQYAVGWDPRAGNLLLYGVTGSGTSTALVTLALALARARPADDLHLYGLDFGAGQLTPLAGLPHTGAIISVRDTERQGRLLRHLAEELARRQLDGPAGHAAIVVLLDNYGGFAAQYMSSPAPEAAVVQDDFRRVFADGPEVGIHVALSADRAGAVPMSMASTVQQRLVFALGDRGEYAQLGIPRDELPPFVPGRAVIGGRVRAIQVGWPGDSVADAVGRIPSTPARRRPRSIGRLPERVAAVELRDAVRLDGEPWLLPVGIGDERLEPTGFELYAGEHVLVAGPPRSGRSSVLAALAHLAAEAGAEVLAVGGRRSPLRHVPSLAAAGGPDALSAMVERIAAGDGPRLLLVDDAETVDDPNGVLTPLLERGEADLHVVAAGRADGLRGGYPMSNHWTAIVRRAKIGLLLRPDRQADSGLLGTTLPRGADPSLPPGRGYLVAAGRAELVQAAAAELVPAT